MRTTRLAALSLFLTLSISPAAMAEDERFLVKTHAGEYVSISPAKSADLSASGQRIGTNEFGVSTSYLNISPSDFAICRNGYADAYIEHGSYIRPVAAGDVVLATAPIHLPAGSVITSMTWFYYDGTITDWVDASLYRYDTSTGSGVFVEGFNSGGSANPGLSSGTMTLAEPLVIDNVNYHYALNMGAGRDVNGWTGLVRVRIEYHRQVSPAPSVATFTDVPTTHGFFKFVEALVAAGITGGCGGGNYCPDAPLTRGQMAVFLASALGLHFAP